MYGRKQNSSSAEVRGDVEEISAGRFRWEDPDLTILNRRTVLAPDFPLDLLGTRWEEWVRAKADAASCPVDYVAAALLTCIGAALANVRWPKAGADWSEPPIMWTAVVGSPSAGKSPGLSAALDLITHVEDQWFSAEHRPWNEGYRERKSRASPVTSEDPSLSRPTVTRRLRVSDVTTERLASIAAVQHRGLLLFRDELAGWILSFDRYNKSGADRAFATEMYGGRAFTVDRVSGPDTIRVRRLSIGVLGGIQPDKLKNIFGAPDDGLVSRILWSWPEPLPDFKLARKKLDDRQAQQAFAKITDLEMVGHSNEASPKILPLESAAEDRLEQFAQRIARQGPAEQRFYAGSLGKARGHVLRLSCVLTHLWWSKTDGPEPESISEEAVIAATRLMVEYFHPMALRAYGHGEVPTDQEAAVQLADYLRQTRSVSFNARDLGRKACSLLRDSRNMADACRTLEQAGLIRPDFKRAGSNAGRLAKNYIVNPMILDDWR